MTVATTILAASLIVLSATPPLEPVQSPPPDSAATQSTAPFGLRWRTPSSEITRQGVNLKKEEETAFGATFSASNVPKVLVDQRSTLLFFGYDDRLIRVGALGKANSNDRRGGGLRRRFTELSEILSRKYGAPIDTTDVTSEHYDGDSYAFGLNTKRNTLQALFDGEDMRILLLGSAEGSSDTYWMILFEHKQGVEELERVREKKEQDTL